MKIDVSGKKAGMAVRGLVDSIVYSNETEFAGMGVSCVVDDEEPWIQVIMTVKEKRNREELDIKAQKIEEALKEMTEGRDIDVAFTEGSFL